MADRNEIDCPRAASWMTPCVARDGKTACTDREGPTRLPETVVCVGCGQSPLTLLRELGDRYAPARRYRQTHEPTNAADVLTRLVAEYVGATTEEPSRG